MERRRSRASFTKSLKRICQRIDSQRVFEVEWNDWYFHNPQKARLQVNALWVAGSYARGALQCGDLDLVADIVTEEGGLPGKSTISRNVIGRFPDVRLYIGTPDENSSRVTFPEALLIWSPKTPDWQAAIDSIPIDPNATRFNRPHDILPLRKEQIADYGEKDTFEQIISLLDQGLLTTEWVPLSDITVHAEEWSYAATEFFDCIERWCGKKTQELMPYVIEWCMDKNSSDLWHRDHSEKTRFKIGGAEVCVGRPYIDLRLLESLACSAIVIVPHISQRGPNGIWKLSRGVTHPLEQQFSACKAYYLAYGNQPSIVEETDDWKRASCLELFSSRELAEEWQKNFDDDEDDYEILEAVGSELLSLLSCVDLVEMDSSRYAVTRGGQFFDETEIVTPEDMVSALTPLPKKLKYEVSI
ncbi:MAG: hypothetical protein FIA91_13265 [Geobacter sp.]|nr:hypothetical protein [Geobacter sp.]